MHSTVLTSTDKRFIGQAAAILLTTDEIERRLPPDFSPECVTISLEDGEGGVTISTPVWARASAPHLHENWNAEFNHPLLIIRGET
jgi:hypothetical protein